MMKLFPKLIPITVKKPYHLGIKTGILFGFGSAWLIKSALLSETDIVVPIAILIIGTIQYFKETKDLAK